MSRIINFVCGLFTWRSFKENIPIYTAIGAFVGFVIAYLCTLVTLTVSASDYIQGPANWPPKNPMDLSLLGGTWESVSSPGQTYKIFSNDQFSVSNAGSGNIKYHSAILYLFEFPGPHPRHQCWYDIGFQDRRSINLEFKGGDAACLKGQFKKQCSFAGCKY